MKQAIARQHVECTAALMYTVLQYIHHKQLDHNLAVTINKYKAFTILKALANTVGY